MIRLPRYTKAAGDQGSQVTLTCFIRTEPGPKVGWLKDGQIIQLPEGQPHPKYQVGLIHVRPGLYRATLVLNNVQKTDFGKYQCQAVNLQGEATLDIQMSGTSTPDVPLNLRLLNATMNTLRVAWTQGFDGGLSQTFQVRWRQVEAGSMYRYADVAANDNHNAVEYLITGAQVH
ncbi:unnamed protein product [Echinostoma caproni]|uniref:Ig-like domain-containing protein n=1 Tax=Echinostoma caproni TaxID=27848 RepID=A0A183B3D6_9TREM|nr:unnamed protein product [Echinostoma caproni]